MQSTPVKSMLRSTFAQLAFGGFCCPTRGPKIDLGNSTTMGLAGGSGMGGCISIGLNRGGRTGG